MRRDELAVDEVPEHGAVLLQPGPRLAVCLGSGTVLHGLVVMCDAHRRSLIPQGGG